MGDRGHIIVYDWTGAPVILYSHWQAHHLPEILAEALAHRVRWRDSEYLARIIADTLSGHSNEFRGMGIGTSRHGDTWRHICVHPQQQQVIFEDPGGVVTDDHAGERYTFEGFIEEFLPEHLDAGEPAEVGL